MARVLHGVSWGFLYFYCSSLCRRGGSPAGKALGYIFIAEGENFYSLRCAPVGQASAVRVESLECNSLAPFKTGAMGGGKGDIKCITKG